MIGSTIFSFAECLFSDEASTLITLIFTLVRNELRGGAFCENKKEKKKATRLKRFECVLFRIRTRIQTNNVIFLSVSHRSPTTKFYSDSNLLILAWFNSVDKHVLCEQKQNLLILNQNALTWRLEPNFNVKLKITTSSFSIEIKVSVLFEFAAPDKCEATSFSTLNSF